MRVLLDSNVWMSGFATHGLCADLIRLALRRHGLGDSTLLLCEAVRVETLRILREKFGASENDLDPVRTAMAWAEDVAAAAWDPPEGFPDPDDAAIVGAALAAGAELFVTGDKALLALTEIDGLPIVSPRAAYQRLRGLD